MCLVPSREDPTHRQSSFRKWELQSSGRGRDSPEVSHHESGRVSIRASSGVSPQKGRLEGPRRLTFAGSNVVQVEFVSLLGALQGAFGGKEVAGGVEGLVVIAAHLWAKHRAPRLHSQSPSLVLPSLPTSEMETLKAKQGTGLAQGHTVS